MNKGIINVVQLDCSEERKNHASRLLKKVKDYATLNQICYIEGELDVCSPIGSSNLKNFYLKNGFKINGTRFELELIP